MTFVALATLAPPFYDIKSGRAPTPAPAPAAVRRMRPAQPSSTPLLDRGEINPRGTFWGKCGPTNRQIVRLLSKWNLSLTQVSHPFSIVSPLLVRHSTAHPNLT